MHLIKGKKIGIVTTWFERGAAYVSKQFKEVWEKENQVFIYVRGGESVALNESVWKAEHITYGKRYPYTYLDKIDIVHFKQWIIDCELDIVFFNEQHLWKPVLAAKELKITIGAYIDYYTKETVPLFEIYDFLICNTKRHTSVFNWHPQVFYVPWGTNTNIYNGTQQKQINPSLITFFHSAGMNPYRKGTDYVIKAFEKMKTDQTKLLIHTQANLDQFFPKLKTTIQKLIESNSLEIVQQTISAPGLYHKGDVYVYPSRLEGIGLTIAEASACGMPVITTDEAPMNEFVIDEVNGKRVKVASTKERGDGYYWEESYVDLEDLVTKMSFYVTHLNKLSHFKEKALVYAQEHLSWDKNGLQLLEIINKVELQELSKKIVNKILAYEKSKGLKFYIANLVVFHKVKTWVKKVLN